MEDFKVGQAKGDEPKIQQPEHAGVVPEAHFRWILSGPSKSGKSNLAKWSLDRFYRNNTNKNKSWFDRIYLLSPTAHLDYMWADLDGLTHKDRISKPTTRHLTGILQSQIKKIAGSTNESALKHMSAKALARRKIKADKVLIIFDDAIAESKLINSSEFLKVFIQGRHYGISSMVMTQSYMRVPRSVRLQATHISMFPSRTTEMDRLFHEFGPKSMSRADFIEMIHFATTPTEDDHFPFVHVDAFAPESIRFRRNFTDVIQLDTTKDQTPDAEAKEPTERPKKRRRDPDDEPKAKRARGHPKYDITGG
jgi:hypothetical protein